MPEFHSPLSRTGGTRIFFDSPGDAPLISLSEYPVGRAFQVSGWGSEFEENARKVMAEFGVSGPGTFGAVQTAKNARSFRLAPNRALVICETHLPLPEYDGENLALLDLSHARIRIKVHGTKAAEMLQCCAPLDCSPAAFPSDHFAQTGIHEIPVLIDRTEAETFILYAPYTWASCLWGRLIRAANALGSTEDVAY